MPNKKTVLGIAIGVGCTLAAPYLAPMARSFVKSVLVHSLLVANELLEKLSVAAEGVQDLVAEVRAEVDEALSRKGPPSRGRADGPSVEVDAVATSERVRSGAPS